MANQHDPASIGKSQAKYSSSYHDQVDDLSRKLRLGKVERLNCGRRDIKRAAAQVWTKVWTSAKRPPVTAASKSLGIMVELNGIEPSALLNAMKKSASPWTKACRSSPEEGGGFEPGSLASRRSRPRISYLDRDGSSHPMGRLRFGSPGPRGSVCFPEQGERIQRKRCAATRPSRERI